MSPVPSGCGTQLSQAKRGSERLKNEFTLWLHLSAISSAAPGNPSLYYPFKGFYSFFVFPFTQKRFKGTRGGWCHFRGSLLSFKTLKTLSDNPEQNFILQESRTGISPLLVSQWIELTINFSNFVFECFYSLISSYPLKKKYYESLTIFQVSVFFLD